MIYCWFLLQHALCRIVNILLNHLSTDLQSVDHVVFALVCVFVLTLLFCHLHNHLIHLQSVDRIMFAFRSILLDASSSILSKLRILSFPF